MKRPPKSRVITRSYSLPAELDAKAELLIARLKEKNPDLDRSTWLRNLIREKVQTEAKAA